jgi:metal-dependent amidase/aminoacylase/carboxypeptidase family protein
MLVFPVPLKAPHHNPRFDVDEGVITLAVRCVTRLAMEL